MWVYLEVMGQILPKRGGRKEEMNVKRAISTPPLSAFLNPAKDKKKRERILIFFFFYVLENTWKPTILAIVPYI